MLLEASRGADRDQLIELLYDDGERHVETGSGTSRRGAARREGLADCEGDYDGDQVLNHKGEALALADGQGVREQSQTAGAPLPDEGL
ncbi:hypothetical protein ACIA74_31845 [Streptomyces sp. NPDC051658]|uniref:hypothetical protein n=1 Tax=Streptomyces sp. NPDC051658 TaxID=3365667 RepID=UPI0037B5D158